MSTIKLQPSTILLYYTTCSYRGIHLVVWCNSNVISNYLDTFHISKVGIWCRSEPQWGWGSEAISCSYSYLHSWWLGILLPWTCSWYGFSGERKTVCWHFLLHQELKTDPAILLLQNCIFYNRFYSGTNGVRLAIVNQLFFLLIHKYNCVVQVRTSCSCRD